MDLCSASKTNEHAAINAQGEGGICNDLWPEILSRLPQKTLTRLQCVSKSWKRLISAILLVRSQTKAPISGFFLHNAYRSPESLHYLPIPTGDRDNVDSRCTDRFFPSDRFLPPPTTIVDCRDGFLLCSSSRREPKNYYLCNPITREWLSLTPPPPPVCTDRMNAALVFDDSSRLSSSHPYRIFRFITVFHRMQPHLGVDIYSSKTGQWARCECPLFSLTDRPSVLYEGAVHLLGNLRSVLRFDVKKECCDKIRFPDYPGTYVSQPVSSSRDDFNFTECLGVCEGRLCLAISNGHNQLLVWVLEDCESRKWVLKHSAEHGLKEGPLDIMAFHPSSDAVLVRRSHDFYWYDFLSRSLEKIMSCSNPADNYAMGFRVYPFSECYYIYQRH